MHAVEIFELVLILLGLVIGLYWLALKLKWPPSAALLVGGGALAFVPGIPSFSLDPELALVLFLPPLLMDGAYTTPLGRFRRQLPGILSLAVGAVIFTTLTVGVTAHWLMPELPWAACFALGAIVSPPDAVAARAVLKGVHLPRRCTSLLEGESLLNDATGLILFRFAVAATLSGVFNLGEAVTSFIMVAIGGVIVGLVIGFGWLFLVKRLKDSMLTILITALLSWTAYLAGEAAHVSGVLSVVAAGLVMGWYQHEVLSAAVRLSKNAFLRVMTFVLEAMIFMLIGFSLRGALDRVGGVAAMPTSWWLVMAGVVAAITIARFVWIYGSDLLVMLLRRAGIEKAKPLGWRQGTVLGWAGMRGVVTLAVALTLPLDMPGRDLMLICAFTVIFVTVIVQGSSLGWMIRKVNPVDTEPEAEMLMPEVEACISRERMKAMEQLAYDEDGELVHPQMLELHRVRHERMEKYAANVNNVQDGLYENFTIMLTAHAEGRKELIRLHRAGLIEDDVLHELERDLDIEEMALIFQRGDAE